MNEESLRLATGTGGTQVILEKDARYQVDGLPADWQAVAKKGGEVVVYPKRGRTSPSLRSTLNETGRAHQT